jgi:hypothetical protein
VAAAPFSVPISAVTNYHNLAAKNNTDLFSYSSKDKSKIKVLAGLCFFLRLQRKIHFLALFGFWKLPEFFGLWSLPHLL